jgi:hypothetical protein
MSAIDDAIQGALTDQSRVVTEWVLFACTQAITDENSAGGYVVSYRSGMLPHHISGLIDQGIELLEYNPDDD